jgi:hypothetical protein
MKSSEIYRALNLSILVVMVVLFIVGLMHPWQRSSEFWEFFIAGFLAIGAISMELYKLRKKDERA